MESNKSVQTVVQGDCLVEMRKFADKQFDLVLTDPPYGVEFGYDSIEDTKAELKKLVDAFMPEALRVAKRVVVTCGNGNQSLYPSPTWTMAWISTAGAGQNAWGFTCWQPVLCYGKDPYRENGMGARRDIIMSNETSAKSDHPCPKPIEFWKTLMDRCSVKESDTILDPFAGSGTTGVAAKQLKRNCTLIEISPKYIEIIKSRLSQESLF